MFFMTIVLSSRSKPLSNSGLVRTVGCMGSDTVGNPGAGRRIFISFGFPHGVRTIDSPKAHPKSKSAVGSSLNFISIRNADNCDCRANACQNMKERLFHVNRERCRSYASMSPVKAQRLPTHGLPHTYTSHGAGQRFVLTHPICHKGYDFFLCERCCFFCVCTLFFLASNKVTASSFARSSVRISA